MVKAAAIPKIELNNGIRMPQIGLGVWEIPDGAETRSAITTALQAGYRLIDTARLYGNETSVGQAVRDSGLPREEIFVTTKLWNDEQGYDSTLRAYDRSLERLGLDYVDLYLIHWPAPARGLFKRSWQALEKLYADKRVRAIGVSNFRPRHLEELQDIWEVVPMVNQIELHPYEQQIETRQFCEEHGISIESYSPLQRGGQLLAEPLLVELADKYGKSPAQIVLRWHIQEGLIVIPKSATLERIRENIDIFDFEMHEDDIELIRELNREQREFNDPEDPDEFND